MMSGLIRMYPAQVRSGFIVFLRVVVVAVDS